MSDAFVVKVKDVKQRRIVIDKKAWEDENLQKNDYIRVKIEKIKV